MHDWLVDGLAMASVVSGLSLLSVDPCCVFIIDAYALVDDRINAVALWCRLCWLLMVPLA
jgi:hypothetical protein